MRNVESHWRTAPKMVATIMSSLAALGSLCSSIDPIRPPYASTADALRSDWLRIGADFKAVIRRRNDRVKSAAE
jgi:hypothetical protein